MRNMIASTEYSETNQTFTDSAPQQDNVHLSQRLEVIACITCMTYVDGHLLLGTTSHIEYHYMRHKISEGWKITEIVYEGSLFT